MILVATCSEYPHPTPNLEALLAALRARGMEAGHRPWKTTPIETFATASAVLPLCCWDYYDDPEKFLGWIDALEAGGAAPATASASGRGRKSGGAASSATDAPPSV